MPTPMFTIIFESATVLMNYHGHTDRLLCKLPKDLAETVRGKYFDVFKDVTFHCEITSGTWKEFCQRLGLEEVTVINMDTGERTTQKL